MVISRLQAWTSSMLKPKVSLPKTSATFSPRLAACSNSGTKSRGVCSGAVISRRRLVRAQAMVVSARASSKEAAMVAFSKTSAAPEARMKLSSGNLNDCGCSGSNTGGFSVIGVAIRLGATMVNLCRPIVFMARAAEPILAGWLVRVRMMRMLSR